MELKKLLSVMALPQHFDGKNLSVNILVVPTNTDPFVNWNTGLASPNSVPGFADFQPQFSLGIVRGTDDFPISNPLNPDRMPVLVPVTVTEATKKASLLEKVSKSFNLTIGNTNDKLPPVIEVAKSVKKYLPETYRKSFNFTQPRHPNAVTDDSYECAVRDKLPLQPVAPVDKISWGKIFAQILKQPLLAEACGMVYKVTIPLEESWFENGGFIYADIVNDPYASVQDQLLEHSEGPLIKRYAARIPALVPGIERPVFAAVTFPVVHKKNSDPTPVIPLGPWDEVFQEARIYDDGFAKIVHANQPKSGNLIKEKRDGFHPQTEAGIRLGWDDEQILVWYIRQLTENTDIQAIGSGLRLDAPLGVMGYHIDVKEAEEGSMWESLNEVEINPESNLGKELAASTTELPYQVYPTKLTGKDSSNFWLPMYYAHWIGKSMVTEDLDALLIYKNNQANGAILKGSQVKKVDPNSTLIPAPIDTVLRYGQSYDFRIRLTDISGGGPKVDKLPLNSAPNPVTNVAFKRYVIPGMLRIEMPSQLLNQTGEYFNSTDLAETSFSANPKISLHRPLLEYPAVVFTQKYQKVGRDPIAELKNVAAINNVIKPALPDPDVNEVYIRVEVKSLRMDNILSQNGSDSYITLYQTKRFFPSEFDEKLDIPIEFIDVPVLNLGEEANPFFIDNLKNSDLDEMDQLILPTGRNIRVTLRGLASSDDDPDEYFGSIDTNIENDSRYGKVTQLSFYKEPSQESQLLFPYGNVPELQGIFLRPESVPTIKKNLFSHLLKRVTETGEADIVNRLADALGCKAKGMTLLAPKGERIAFGCSSRIQHSLAPDGSSVTFASKAELQSHWLGGLSCKMERDWTWDCLENDAFQISKRYKFRRDLESEWRNLKNAGEIELKHTISFEALQEDRFGEINRGYTRLVFIDAIEPKNDLKRDGIELRFPDEIWVNYKLTPKFKPNHVPTPVKEFEELTLPTVIAPSQMPKMKSVGLAFSPYDRSDDYSSTEVRRRHLWIEFEEPVENPDDLYFCRMLANAPDQLISNNAPEQLIAPEESPLNLDPELTRIITPGQSDDMAAIGAMQQMTKSLDSDRHFILPLPPGMHAESPELFGFFTYEFRVGHAHFDGVKDNLWSTAQARFGRALRVTGIQHPAPNLLCTLNRGKQQMYVTSPFAKAVMNGKNVTSKPPRTSLWAVLYAQVFQADGLDFRNILLGEKEMQIGIKIVDDKKEYEQFKDLEKIASAPNKVPTKVKSSFVQNDSLILKGHLVANLKELHPVGTAKFSSEEIASRLKMFGLPEDSPLSVLVVEVFGNITNIFDHFEQFQQVRESPLMEKILENVDKDKIPPTNTPEEMRPLSRGLGHFRILRTSPLTRVPFVCCPTCE
ncbi:hypothetical protein [Algoriphagus winogradskyi]|uniref:Uncharacterized protein n=1 Tax=Algoriphagus winogradskyi TaxID=237017 RepID=A0ABY1PEV1_9BACT|nr:hypothetical protein [Algoriphagus winogradskyi]SMP32642.1 hypothetical protein SAMN06265367_10856 [Algoriphagus winogradskyi]